MKEQLAQKSKIGTITACLANICYGLMPIYWSLAVNTDSFEIMTHKAMWQLLFYGIITFKNYLFHWSVPRNNFYNFFDLFFHLCDLSVITVKLFFFALAFFYIQLYSVFQSQILFFSWTIDLKDC